MKALKQIPGMVDTYHCAELLNLIYMYLSLHVSSLQIDLSCPRHILFSLANCKGEGRKDVMNEAMRHTLPDIGIRHAVRVPPFMTPAKC